MLVAVRVARNVSSLAPAASPYYELLRTFSYVSSSFYFFIIDFTNIKLVRLSKSFTLMLLYLYFTVKQLVFLVMLSFLVGH